MLGLEDTYQDYSDKLIAYCNYLLGPNLNAERLDEDDYVLFLDAFDVLLFPRLHADIYHYMAQSQSPIVFCAENGIYPEFSSEHILYNYYHKYCIYYYWFKVLFISN